MGSSVWLLAFERLLSNEEAADQAFAKGGIDLTAMKQVIASGDEDGDELVSAFADLLAEGFDVEGDVDDGEGVSPCGSVEPVAFDEDSVDVGEDGFYHVTHL
jgi:hypothetical protein